MDSALSVLKLMMKHRPEAMNEHVFSIVLNACAVSRRMSVVESLLVQMQQLGVPRTALTFSILFKGYGRQKRPQKITELVEQIEREVCIYVSMYAYICVRTYIFMH